MKQFHKIHLMVLQTKMYKNVTLHLHCQCASCTLSLLTKFAKFWITVNFIEIFPEFGSISA